MLRKTNGEFDQKLKKSNLTAQKPIAGNLDMIIPVLTVPVAREDWPV
jgi:predicted RNA methylase